MLRRRRRQANNRVRQRKRLPPIEFSDAFGLYTPIFQVRTDTEWRDERHARLGERTNGWVVEMIVVIVRDHHDVDRRHLAKRYGHRLKTFRSDERGGRRT